MDAYSRLQNPRPVRPWVVVGVGVLGLAANLVAASVLASDRDDINVEGAFRHLLADAAGSVAAVAVGLALTVTDLYVLDAVFAVAVAALVLYATFDLLRDALNELLQGAPRDVDVDAVAAFLASREGVVDVHDVHVWALTPGETALSAHVVVSETADPHAVLDACQSSLADAFGIAHATVQVESPGHTERLAFDCYRSDDTPPR